MAKPEHTDVGEYNNEMPKKVPVPDCCGYPDPKPNTQTKLTRGTGAATQGKNHSKNSN